MRSCIPNVASVFERGETAEGLPYLVMEHVHGLPLSVHRRRSLRSCVLIVRQVLEGLALMHASGIVYGDVKSDNVLVERMARGLDVAKLIDLGLASVAIDGDCEPSGEVTMFGTPEYMAPELFRGHRATPSSDLYAVGCVLYEVITGTTPFAGRTMSHVTARHLDDAVVPPSLRCPDLAIPPILDRIVMRALEKDPLDRFDSARGFASALAIVIPCLDDASRRPLRFSATAVTLDWKPGAPFEQLRRGARGTPRRQLER